MTEQDISTVLDEYEKGRLTRRQVLARLAGGRIYFPDADGLEVQLASRGHRA